MVRLRGSLDSDRQEVCGEDGGGLWTVLSRGKEAQRQQAEQRQFCGDGDSRRYIS